MNELMREKILRNLEQNSRINVGDLAIMLGVSEAEVANEISLMEKEHIIGVDGRELLLPGIEYKDIEGYIL